MFVGHPVHTARIGVLAETVLPLVNPILLLLQHYICADYNLFYIPFINIYIFFIDFVEFVVLCDPFKMGLYLFYFIFFFPLRPVVVSYPGGGLTNSPGLRMFFFNYLYIIESLAFLRAK